MINRGSITRKYIYIYKLETEESSFKNWRVSRRISILHWKFDSPGTSCALSKTRGAKWFHNFLIANLSHHAARSPHPSLENFLPDFSAREVSANVTFFPPSSFSYFINFQASKEKCWRNNKCVWTHRFDIEIRKKKKENTNNLNPLDTRDNRIWWAARLQFRLVRVVGTKRGQRCDSRRDTWECTRQKTTWQVSQRWFPFNEIPI